MQTEVMNLESGFISKNKEIIGKLLGENFDGVGIYLEKIKMPINGTTYFEMPTATEEPDIKKEFNAVILRHFPTRSLYVERGNESVLECASMDARTSNDGKPCSDCEHAYNGTCKLRRTLYFLIEGFDIPMYMSIPTSSVTEFSKYMTRLLNSLQSVEEVVTKFSVIDVSYSGKKYSKLQFAKVRDLYSVEKEYIDNEIKPYVKQISKQSDATDELSKYVTETANKEIEMQIEAGRVL